MPTNALLDLYPDRARTHSAITGSQSVKSPKSLRAVAAATPLAIAAILAAAPQASAGISDAALNNPHVLDHGNTLGLTFSSAVSDQATDNAIARNIADDFIGNWAGGLLESAMRNEPPDASTCDVTVTATDPDGAKGTVSAAVPAGVTNNELAIPDQAPGAKWRAGDVDHFNVQLTCTDAQHGNRMSKAILDQDQAAS